MSIEALIRRLRRLDPGCFTRQPPASPESLDAHERAFHLHLPRDYRQLMLFSDGMEVQGPRSVLHLESARTLLGHNMDETFAAYLPGMFVIGDDAGGSLFFLDPADQLGKGAYAVFLVAQGAMRRERALFAASTVSAAVEDVLSGVDFYARHGLDKRSGV